MTDDWFPLWLSLRVASSSTLIALVLGLWAGSLLASPKFKGGRILDAVVTLPLVTPPTVLGWYLLVLFTREGPLGRLHEFVFGTPLLFTWRAAVVAAVLHSAPLMIKFTTAALESVPGRYAAAARSLGARPWRIFWNVTLPQAWNQILAATALVFARSLGEFGMTLMLAGSIPGKTQTVSVAVYDAVKGGEGAAARMMVLAISALILILVAVAVRCGRVSIGKAVR